MSTHKARKKATTRGGISHAKLLSTSALTAAGLVALMPNAALAIDANADWDGISIVGGNATVTDTGLGTTNIDQHSMQAIGEAQELHIGEMGHVNIDQTDGNALFVARAIGNHSDPTQILGMLTADGRVMILDRNGVLFGANSRVDVAGIAVSTGEVSNADIMDGDGKFTFENFGDGSIKLEGTINVADAGLAAFVSPTVANSGVINAKLGTVAMAAGEKVTLDLYGDGLVEITLDGELSDALLSNTGTINAEGGKVIMTAQAAKDAVDDIINVSGIVNVSSATQQGGKIVLSGGNKGKVKVSGNLNANGEGGGDIEVTGQNVHITETAELSADAGQNGDGGEVKIIADNTAIINGRVNARGGAQSGNGGFVDTSAFGYLGITHAKVDTSAANGLFGTWLIDPLDFQLILGSGDTSNDGDSAPDQNLKWVVGGENTYASTTSHIYESELEAQNTNVVLRAQRNFSVANGSGYGGTLGDGIIQMKANRSLTIETENTAANAGSINLTGSSFGSSLVFKTTGTGAITINGSTNGGGVSNITLSKLQSENGNITIDTNNGDINANGAITISGTGNLKMTADHSAADDGDVRINAAVSTQAGKVELTAEHDVYVTGTGSITTKNGDVFLTGLAPTGESNVLIEGNVTTNGGDINVVAGDDIRVRAVLNTAGTSGSNPSGNVSLRALGNNAADNAEITISNTGRIVTTDNLAFGAAEGNVWLEAEDLIIDTASGNKIDTTDDGVNDGTVTITRSTDGSIGLGSPLYGDLQVDNGELNAITTQNLTIGDPAQASSKVTNILLSNVDTTANVSGLLSLNTWLNEGTGVPINSVGPNAFDNNNIGFYNVNKTNALTANANDHVIIYSGSSLTTNGETILNADANKQGVGALVLGVGAQLNSQGKNITFTGHEALILGSAKINADGGNITLNNDSLFYSQDANTLITKGAGKITLNQHNDNFTTVFDGVTPFNQNGSINNAVRALANADNGQNTLYVYAGNLGNTYNENITIDQANLKMDGVTGENVVIAGNGIDEVIKVTASNFNLDPVTIDGNGAFYGITAAGAGANGLVIDGNTFRDTKSGGILISNSTGGTSTVKNNIFEGTGSSDSTATRGVQIGTLTGGSTVNIENNTFGGGALGTLVNAVLGQGAVTGGNVNITGANTASTSNNAVVFQGNITGGSAININGLTATSTTDTVRFNGFMNASKIDVYNSKLISTNEDALKFANGIAGNSTIHIGANTLQGGSEGIEFTGGIADSTIRISQWNGKSFGAQTITGNKNGIIFRQDLNNSEIQLGGNTINGLAGDGIRFEGALNNSRVYGSASDGTKYFAGGNTITGSDDGIVFDEIIKNGSKVTLISGQITGQDGDGIRFAEDVNNSAINLHGLEIKGQNGTGVLFEGHVTNGAAVNIGDGSLKIGNFTLGTSGNSISGTNNGVKFNGVDGSKTSVRIANNISISGGLNGILFGAGSPSVDGATVNITDNAMITGLVGVKFEDEIVNNATVNIQNNTKIEGTANDAILFDDQVKGSTVNVTGNKSILAFEDGVHFSDDIDGSKITVSSNKIDADDHGIYFGDVLENKSTVNIHDNIILANQDEAIIGSGIFFDGGITNTTVNIGDGNTKSNGGSNLISVKTNTTIKAGDINNLDGIHFNNDIGTGAVINIDGNRIGYTGTKIDGTLTQANIADDGIEFRGQIGSNAQVNIIENSVRATDDGIVFADEIDNDNGSEQEIFIDNNNIVGGNNGIHFIAEISDNGHDTRISNNTIEGKARQGVVFDDTIDEAHIRIVENKSIKGKVDAVRFLGRVQDGARINIDDNIDLIGVDEEGVHFFQEISESQVSISGNDNIVAGDHGLQFAGDITDSVIAINGNNHGIHAKNHGILFEGNVWYGSDIDIHDNIISADEDGDTTGDGIHFAGDVYTATINIGDGNGTKTSGASNIIKGWDGIHFNGDVTNGAKIVIDGNRLGYYANSVGGTLSTGSGTRLRDDGIQFVGDIDEDATVTITDNYIRSEDDGVSFIGEISDNAKILIGGSIGKATYGNVIDANGDGIQFEDNIIDHSLIEISRNTIDADENGIEFNGDTSNHDHGGHAEEILIAYNDIEGGENGILFEGEASNELHDIMIRNNSYIGGDNGDGIAHIGNINDAELWILNNEEIFGSRDGVHVEGFFTNDARIEIDGNTDISADDGDGIEVTQYGGAGGVEVNITDNFITEAGDNGIEVDNVEGVDILRNDITRAGNDGINVDDSDYADIEENVIHGVNGGFLSIGAAGAGRDGIHVTDSDNVDILNNVIRGGNGGFLSIGGAGAGRDGINVDNSDNVDIYGNDIFGGNGALLSLGGNGAGRDGIHVTDSFDADIQFNDIYGGLLTLGAVRHGIFVDNADFADVRWNDISEVGEDGINVDDSYRIDIVGNEIANAGDDGIQVDDSFGVDVFLNSIIGVGEDGIDVNDSAFADIALNLVAGALDNGIEVTNSFDADVALNLVLGTGNDGIYVYNSDFADIRYNFVALTGGDGIDVERSFGTDIVRNAVFLTADNGIELQGSNNSTIDGNIVAFVGENGIYVNPSNNVTIKNNYINFTGDDGIDVNGGKNITITNNKIGTFGGNIGDDGIDVDGSTNVTISGNEITDADEAGIELTNTDIVNVLFNNIHDNGDYGLWARGGGNGLVVLTGNTFTDNPVHARFESGLIDLTGVSAVPGPGFGYGNRFIGGNVALNFTPFGGDTTLLALVDDDGIPGYDTFNGTDVFPPTNFGGTIGRQYFSGQSQYFVELGQNAFLDGPGGNAIWLNALDSTYDASAIGYGDVTPNTYPGFMLPVDLLAFLEERFFHFPDVPGTRGIFFFGREPIEIAQEDLQKLFDLFSAGPSGLNVTLTGLPSIAGASRGATPFNLNAIAPAAGDEAGAEAGIQTAAATSAQDLADIEPAAGGSDAACWADAVSMAGAGTPVNFDFGGSFEESIADAAGCGAQSF